MKQIKIFKIQFAAIAICMVMAVPSAVAQWASPGAQTETHGIGNQPRILGFGGGWLELAEGEDSGGDTGLMFSRQNGFNYITEAHLHWNFGRFTFTGSNKNTDIFTITASTGDVAVFGELEVAGEIVGASDARLKKDMAPLTDALTKVSLLKPTTYQFRNDEFSNKNFPVGTRMGFIAQEVEKEFPTLVSTGNEVSDIHGNSFDMKSVNYMEVIPLLTKAIQEQQALIEQLTGTVASLKAQVELSSASASR